MTSTTDRQLERDSTRRGDPIGTEQRSPWGVSNRSVGGRTKLLKRKSSDELPDAERVRGPGAVRELSCTHRPSRWCETSVLRMMPQQSRRRMSVLKCYRWDCSKEFIDHDTSSVSAA